MNEKTRRALIGLIWPGPITGPLPVNFFRVLAVSLVFYLTALPAALVMAFLTALAVTFYFRLLELSAGKKWTENLLKKIPPTLGEKVRTRGPLALFGTSFLIGVFPYAIFLKLLKYPEATSEVLLVLASIANSLVWTGIFWGTIVGLLRQIVSFAF